MRTMGIRIKDEDLIYRFRKLALTRRKRTMEEYLRYLIELDESILRREEAVRGR